MNNYIDINMGFYSENYLIEEQDRNIKILQQELEQMVINVNNKDFRIKEHLQEMTYHINELMKLKEKLRKLIK